MHTANNGVESCWHCGNLATEMFRGKYVCKNCKNWILHNIKIQILEIITGVVLFCLFFFLMWVIMALTDSNWIPII